MLAITDTFHLPPSMSLSREYQLYLGYIFLLYFINFFNGLLYGKVFTIVTDCLGFLFLFYIWNEGKVHFF